MGWSLISDVCDFLEEIISKGKYDYVVTRERSGDRLYTEAVRLCLRTSVPHIPSKGIFSFPLKEKRVLVFDDSMRTGEHVQKTVDELRRMEALVHVAVYVIHRACKMAVDFYKYKLPESNYVEFQDRISEYLRFLPIPFDTDHIYIIGRLETNSLTESQMRRLLEPLGTVYPSDPSEPRHVSKLTLRPNFCSPESLKLPNYMLAPSTWKIRFLFDKDGYLCIFPLTFLEVAPINELSPHEDFPMCFCQKHRWNVWIRRHPNPAQLLTCYCLIFYCSTQLLSSFLSRWKVVLQKNNINLRVDKCVYEDGEFIFNDPTLSSYLWQTVISSLRDP